VNLTDRTYWEKEYSGSLPDNNSKSVRNPLYRYFSDRLKKIVGAKIMQKAESYVEYCLFKVLSECIGEIKKDSSVIEVGVAPGRNIIKVASTFNLIPYGVDYTTAGTKICKLNFAREGFDPANVYLDDVLSEQFQSEQSEKYDIVLSMGFIEHFQNPDDIVKAHMVLLKPGGHLIISIPNLRGIYWLWTYVFNHPQLALHNIEIMRLREFRKLFQHKKMREQWSGYVGTFSFWLFTFENTGLVKKIVHQILIIVQLMLNVLFRLLFKERGLETSWFSPNLLYVGKKCE